ncbi:MAG TPA: ATP-binding protein, partial [Novosphingobium sp.]|nr:ATP-binding protein [Novosphingobium sp.]
LSALAMALAGERDRRGANRDCRLRVNLRGTERPVVTGDPARLERVLHNLLDNAVSFSPPGGLVEVDIGVEHGTVVAQVQDQGPGIAPAARERVFERFHSQRPSGEDFGAHSGLGLAIARTIIEAHDGTLTAREPEAGRGGARLVIELPAQLPGPEAQ